MHTSLLFEQFVGEDQFTGEAPSQIWTSGFNFRAVFMNRVQCREITHHLLFYIHSSHP